MQMYFLRGYAMYAAPEDVAILCDRFEAALRKGHDYIDYMAKSGAYICFDFFGLECMLGKTFWLPTDKDRVFAILEQIKRGNIKKLLMSHDTVYKSMLRQFGGFGYAHLQKDMLPIMLANGYTQQWLDQITIQNPADVFSLDA